MGFFVNDERIKYNKENDNAELKNINYTIEDIKNDPNTYRDLTLDEAEEKVKILENEIKYYKANDSEKFYDIQIQLQDEQNRLGRYRNEGSLYFKDGKMSEIGAKISKDRLKLLLERNIKPIYNTGIFVSHYDEFSKDSYKNFYLMNDSPNNSSGLYSIYRANEIYKLNYFILGFLLIFFLGAWTYDKESSDNLNLIFTKPIKRQKYHLLIIKNQIKNIGLFLILFYLIFFLTASIFGGIGDYNFPIVKYLGLSPDKTSTLIKQENYYTFMNLSTYILKYLFLLFLAGIFLASLANIISIFLKTRLQLYMSLIVILALGFLLINTVDIPILKTLLPFAYLDAHNLTSHATIVIYKNVKMTALIGSVVLITWSIMLNLFCIGKLGIE